MTIVIGEIREVINKLKDIETSAFKDENMLLADGLMKIRWELINLIDNFDRFSSDIMKEE